jgi:hypothetical protein
MDHLNDFEAPLYKDHLSTVATIDRSLNHPSDTSFTLCKYRLSTVAIVDRWVVYLSDSSSGNTQEFLSGG